MCFFGAKTLKQAVSRVLGDTITVPESVKQLRAEVQFLACSCIFLFVTTFTPIQGSTNSLFYVYRVSSVLLIYSRELESLKLKPPRPLTSA